MKRLFAAAAVVLGAMWFGPPAFATVITGHYVITSQYDNTSSSLMGGGPTITGNLGTGIVNTSTGTSGNFTFNLTAGGAYTAPLNFATFNPYATCRGPGCVGGSSGTETDNITVSFTFTAPSGAAALTDTAIFKAKYALPYLSCDPGGDGLGKSDCVNWGTSPIVAQFTDGARMNIKLNDAFDWAITPTIQFQLTADVTPTQQAAVPEPVSMAVLGIGMAGMGYIRRQRRAV